MHCSISLISANILPSRLGEHTLAFNLYQLSALIIVHQAKYTLNLCCAMRYDRCRSGRLVVLNETKSFALKLISSRRIATSFTIQTSSLNWKSVTQLFGLGIKSKHMVELNKNFYFDFKYLCNKTHRVYTE